MDLKEKPFCEACAYPMDRRELQKRQILIASASNQVLISRLNICDRSWCRRPKRNRLSVRGIKDALRDERGRLIVVEDGSITITAVAGSVISCSPNAR